MNKITTVVGTNASSEVVTTIGIDLAKYVFAIHGINAAGKPILVKPSVRRDQLLELWPSYRRASSA
jgi:transposase